MKHFVKVNGYLVQLERVSPDKSLTRGEWALLVVGVVLFYVLATMVLTF